MPTRNSQENFGAKIVRRLKFSKLILRKQYFVSKTSRKSVVPEKKNNITFQSTGSELWIQKPFFVDFLFSSCPVSRFSF